MYCSEGIKSLHANYWGFVVGRPQE